MKLKIGVMGSASSAKDKETAKKAESIGKAVAEKGAILFYGATIGYPLAAAKAAKEAGGTVVGVSPAANQKEHLEKYGYPVEPCDAVVYTGFGFQGRNVVLARSCDAIIVISGRIGTMSEFSVAYAEHRPIGVLEGSGGFAGKARQFEEEVLSGQMPTRIVYSPEPERLVEMVLEEAEKVKD
jgi:hypothetical protein